MKYFITGITGFIGSNIASYLLAEGHEVNAIVREFKLPKQNNHPNLKLFKGDLDNKLSLSEGMEGCKCVFHLAAFAKPWAKDPDTFRKINVVGTANVFELAKKAGVEKVVFTSSAATMSPSYFKTPSNEFTWRVAPFFNEYESSKSEAENLAIDFSNKGLHVVIVNPSRVYGPGPINASNSITKMACGYCNGKWRIIPGNGRKIGNYVFIDDVVKGHILAAEKGKAGERYILGGENLSFDDLFDTIESVSGIHTKMIHLPIFALYSAAKIMEWQNPITGIPPAFTASCVKKYVHDWRLSSHKAQRNLGYTITPFAAGIRKTIAWLKETSLLKLNEKLTHLKPEFDLKCSEN